MHALSKDLRNEELQNMLAQEVDQLETSPSAVPQGFGTAAAHYDALSRAQFAAQDASRATSSFDPYGGEYLRLCGDALYRTPQCSMYRLRQFFGLTDIDEVAVAGLRDAFSRTVQEAMTAAQGYVDRTAHPDNQLSRTSMLESLDAIRYTALDRSHGYHGADHTLQLARLDAFSGTQHQKDAHSILMAIEDIQAVRARMDNTWRWRGVRELAEFASLAGWVIPWHLIVLNPVLKVAAIWLTAAKHGMRVVFLGTRKFVTAAGRTVMRPVFATGKWLQQRGVLIKEVLHGRIRVKIIANPKVFNRLYSTPFVNPWKLKLESTPALFQEPATLLKLLESGHFNSFKDLARFLKVGVDDVQLYAVNQAEAVATVQLSPHKFLVLGTRQSFTRMGDVINASRGGSSLPNVATGSLSVPFGNGTFLHGFLLEFPASSNIASRVLGSHWTRTMSYFDHAVFRGLTYRGTWKRALDIEHAVNTSLTADRVTLAAVRPTDVLLPGNYNIQPAMDQVKRAFQHGQTNPGWQIGLPTQVIDKLKTMTGSYYDDVYRELEWDLIPGAVARIRGVTRPNPGNLSNVQWDLCKKFFRENAWIRPSGIQNVNGPAGDAIDVIRQSPIVSVHVAP